MEGKQFLLLELGSGFLTEEERLIIKGNKEKQKPVVKAGGSLFFYSTKTHILYEIQH